MGNKLNLVDGKMVYVQGGDYVDADDYDALQGELAEMEQDRDLLQERLEKLADSVYDWADSIKDAADPHR